jgi:hypothetical protein
MAATARSRFFVPPPASRTMPPVKKPPLWSCPKCEAKLVTQNMSYSCGPWTVEGFLEGKGPRARALFDRFVELTRRCGPFTFAPARRGSR